ncbi:MAG: hypothetical protein CM15mV13_1080 [uncultured marine virus]|nr:MAG: hypothetical protein CM15mV13_1080 [uncultured marine virus]
MLNVQVEEFSQYDRPIYKSPIIGQEIREMEKLYMDLARLSIDYPKMDDDGKREHIDATMTLIAKQKVFMQDLVYYLLKIKKQQKSSIT